MMNIIEMKREHKSVAQGDLRVERADRVPPNAVEVRADHETGVVVAHSETGHHHVLERPAKVFRVPGSDDLWAEIRERAAVLRHHKSFDTHAPIQLPPGVYRLIRQREWTPEGYRRVAD